MNWRNVTSTSIASSCPRTSWTGRARDASGSPWLSTRPSGHPAGVHEPNHDHATVPGSDHRRPSGGPPPHWKGTRRRSTCPSGTSGSSRPSTSGQRSSRLECLGRQAGIIRVREGRGRGAEPLARPGRLQTQVRHGRVGGSQRYALVVPVEHSDGEVRVYQNLRQQIEQSVHQRTVLTA